MIFCFNHRYSGPPDHIFIDTYIVKILKTLTVELWLRFSVSKRQNSVSLLKEKDRNSFHDIDCVDLVAKKRLLVPHKSHKEFFIFKN